MLVEAIILRITIIILSSVIEWQRIWRPHRSENKNHPEKSKVNSSSTTDKEQLASE